MEGGAEEHTTVVRRAPWRSVLVAIALGLLAAAGCGDDDQAATGRCRSRFSGGVDLIVYLAPQVTDEQTRRLRDQLQDDDRIDGLRFVDQDETYEEFTVLFADSPQLLRTVTPDILPPSFRLDLDDADDTERMVKELRGADGVYEVLDEAAAGAVPERDGPLTPRGC